MSKKIPKIHFEYSETSHTKGFKIISLEDLQEGRSKVDTDRLYEFHQIEFFAILLIQQGNVKHVLDFKSIELKAGDSLFVTKGQVHAFDPDSLYKGHLLMFSEEFVQKHFAQNALKKIPFLYSPNKAQLIFSSPQSNDFLITTLREKLSQNIDVHANQIGALLSFYLLHFVKGENPVESHNKHYDSFARFNLLVQQQYHLTRNAKDYAAALHISYKHLNEICKYMTNKTSKALIDDYIILEAKRQLVTSALTVKEIGFQLGFNEPTNFRKYFQKHVGLSPNEFLKKMKLVTH